MTHPPSVPPKNIWLSFPEMTPAEAEQLLHFVDMLQQQLWEAYAAAIFDTDVDRSDPPAGDDSGIPF